MLRKIRILLAILSFLIVTALFLDFSGVMHRWFGWMAKIQFVPAVLAVNAVAVVLLVVVILINGVSELIAKKIGKDKGNG